MNLNEILKQRIDKDYLTSKLKENLDDFNNAITIALKNEQPQAWRAAWLLNHCIIRNDKRIKPHIKKIISTIYEREDGHQRELLKLIENISLTEDQEGYVFDICVTIWESIEKSPSVRIVAFRILAKIVKKYPELINEMEHLTEPHYTADLSPGIKNSFEKIRRQLFKS